ncbi:MAG TPA: MG2 domain-containing protein, partial [Steroidobacteraceae bacterium]|nr:MG2 domain-containing protein [Steroidobacteraceae bacterium]
ESSLVWVTRLDNGQPAAGAQITVADYCTGAELWRGAANRDGIAAIGESLGEPHDNDGCYPGSHAPLLATATVPASAKGAKSGLTEDVSFVLSSWDKGIAPHEFGLRMGSAWNADIFHTVLDRPLFRAGETVSMKHFVRRHVRTGIALPEQVDGARRVVISHQGSDQRYEMQASFGADGVAEQSWKIPAEAKLGDYSISIVDAGNNARQSGQFKVEEFRLPTMRASVQGSARPLVRPRNTTLDLHVGYISGGGAAGLPVKVRTVVEESPLRHVGYDDFIFGGAAVREGSQIMEGGGWDLDFEGDAPTTESAKSQVLPVTLDAQGAARVTIPDLPPTENPAQLTAELEYADANGEILTTTGRVKLVPAEVSVGIRREGWAASAEQMRFRLVVLDLDGKPVVGRPVSASLYSSASYSYRKRLIGGFYTYESARENTRLATTCAGKTNAQGLLVCEVAPGVSGEVLVRAEARDVQGQVSGATTSIWVAGKEDWWFGGTAGDRMDVLPENPEYEVGQVARFQVRMPFRSATALVTVEREGVMRSFVTTLSGRAPVVKLPIEAADSPNIYVSVLALRGRVGTKRLWRKTADDSKEVTAFVDLNKPAYRLGASEIRVGWKPHRLDVRVTPDRSTYAVRDQAKITIEVKRADGSPFSSAAVGANGAGGASLPDSAEVAIAAVDEALLELAPNPSWALLDEMMGKRGLEVWTSTAQLQVVGKRHYGRKAVPHGGGGGKERARESFDTLLAWQGRVKLDAQGKAVVTIPLNDSLSSFRVVAVAHANSDLFGTGDASISTTQDLILLSGLPPLVREGDRFAATFTVRNTSKTSIPVLLSAISTPSLPLPAKQLEIPAGEARDIVWEVTAPIGASTLSWEVTAQQSAGAAHDKLKITESVIPAYPVRTYQATLAQLTSPLQIPAERPRQALPGRGGLEVTLRAKLGDGLEGVHEYMWYYPYVCIEQNLSRAVALRDKAIWDSWVDRIPAYLDSDGLLKYFPSEQLQGEDTLTAYVLAIASEAGWTIPEDSRAKLIQALTRFVEGR